MEKINILSNVTIDFLKMELSKQYDVYIPNGYNNWISTIYNHDVNMFREDISATFVIIMPEVIVTTDKKVDKILNEIGVVRAALETYITAIKTPVFISNYFTAFEKVPAISEKTSLEFVFHNRWNTMVEELNSEHKNAFIFDVASLSYNYGRNEFFSSKMWYSSSMPFSLKGIKEISQMIHKMTKATHHNRKKCVVLDLDNTLWHGIAGEGSVELSDHGVGAIYRDFQTQLKRLKETGIVLAIASKNNFDDVKDIINEHPFMQLRFDDFVAYRINWNEKWDSILEISKELNIGLDSMVFIDDNPMEREGMKQFHPEVTTPEFPEDISKLNEWIYALWTEYFYTVSLSDEDKTKTLLYKEEEQRKKIKDSVGSLDEYIRNLEIKIRIHAMKENEISRVTELCNKTNQFNLTTKRYSESDIRELYSRDDFDIYTVTTEDRFGTNGLISVIICRKDMDVTIDTFLMSCRTMGRKIENVIVSQLVKSYKAMGYKSIIGEYIKTKKNAPVENLYGHLGFEKIADNKWVFNLDKDMVNDETIYKEITYEE